MEGVEGWKGRRVEGGYKGRRAARQPCRRVEGWKGGRVEG